MEYLGPVQVEMLADNWVQLMLAMYCVYCCISDVVVAGVEALAGGMAAAGLVPVDVIFAAFK